MPSASFGGGAVRVRAPRGYDTSAATDRTDRDLPSGDRRVAERAALVEALRADDFVVVDRIDLTPRRSRDLGGPAPANRPGTVKARRRRAGRQRRRRPARARRGLLVAPAGRCSRAHALDRPRPAHRLVRPVGAAREAAASEAAVARHRLAERRTGHGRPWAAGRPRPRRPPGDRAALRRPRHRRQGRRATRVGRAHRSRPRHRGSARGMEARRLPLGGGPPHRPRGTGPASRPRHVLVDDRCLRGARRHSRCGGLRRHPRVRVRRRHRLRPPHPQRRPGAQRPRPARPARSPRRRGSSSTSSPTVAEGSSPGRSSSPCFRARGCGSPSTRSSSSPRPTAAPTSPTRSAGTISSTSTRTWSWSPRPDSRSCPAVPRSRRSSAGSSVEWVRS